MSDILDKIKRSLADESAFPSYESSSAQNQRKLMIYAVVAEFLIFIPFAFWISFNEMEYWNTRLLTYASLTFMILTGISGIVLSRSIDATSSKEDVTMKKVMWGRLITASFVILYIVVLIIGAMELSPR